MQKIILRERDNIHVTSFTVYCYNCSPLLIVIVILLLCLIYKLNFVIDMYVCGCRGSVSMKWWDSPPPSGNLEPANQYAPSKKQRES